MTTYTTQTLLQNVVYGVPSGNYDGSSLLFFSNPVPAANYYGGQGNLQTIIYNITGCTANVTLEATLNDLTDQAKWFIVDTQELDDRSDTIPATIIGNFSWLRVRVDDFTQGNINLVSASY